MSIATIEERRLASQQRLDLRKAPAERNRLGQFATPPQLALDIASHAWNIWRHRNEKVRFLDPAIGTGSFYSALRRTVPPNLVATAAGVELDVAFARAASRLWTDTGLEVTAGDFTTIAPPTIDSRFNVILSNPPYVRHHHLPAPEKLRLKRLVAQRLGVEVSGLAGLYCYFLLLADAWLDDDGLACWLIPSEFMDVNYGAVIKHYLTDQVTLLQIHRFCPSDVQFSDALVSSAVVVFKKSPPSMHRAANFTFGGSILRPSRSQTVALARLREAHKWTGFPLPPTRKRTLPQSPTTLSDLFVIKRGLATGANKFFILQRDEAVGRRFPSECIKPILPSPRYLTVPVIEASDDGYPIVEPRLVLVDCRLPEPVLRKRYPHLWNYLKEGVSAGLDRRYLTIRRDPWYSQENRPPAPLLCTYMGRSRNGHSPFRFYRNLSQATAGNVYLLLYPKAPIQLAIRSDPRIFDRVFEILQALDASSLLAEGRVYGGGLHKIEPKELGRLSAGRIIDAIPPFSARQLELFR